MFTTNAVQAGSVPTLQYQEHPQKSQGKSIENAQQKSQQSQPQQEFPTFCYTTNVNMIGKIGTGTTGGSGGVNIAQLTTSDDKTCYIAQPFSYNYALVNQMQLAPNGIQNTISNISFKCDVCGLMFGHLTLLNAHKRIHTQDADNNITVVATGVNSGNDVAMPPHIQIMSTDSNDPQQHQMIQDTKPVIIDKTQSKCITCGGPLSNNPKRKGPKLIRCETCIAQDSVDQRNNQMNATQIFVAAENNVKFEVGGVSGVQPSSDPLATAPPAPPPQQQKTVPAGHHPVKKRNLASVTKCQNCNGSGIVFIGGNKNKNNASNAEKPFHCNICGGSFSRYSSLWSHKKLHSGEKNFKCGVCGIAFAKAVYLKNHSRIHTGEKPYRCQTCGMQFSQSPHLKNHERTHSGEKPYVCEVCDKGFARHATLWNHRRIHTGEKPYKCETCGSAFSQAAHLKNHAKVHSGEKPFKCDICTAAFADRFALKRHRGIHDKYGQTAPLPSRIQQDEHEHQAQQQQSSDQQNAQPDVEHRGQQTTL
ncbi:transcription factor Clamp [Maniola hyperantus]|uniref:transcription factor Clamp n=1 Tax=Aphantopus hyperantus TaxID=2795564 RepID=UPI001568194D|nr:zinc finger protein 234 [Maniola hyperantus]XP_034823961.1 zinc finger protein 234 [Maniola hyperantus]